MNLIKKMLGLALVCAIYSQAEAQSWYNLATTEHVTLQGYSMITSSGCDYGARLVNNTASYVLVPKSKVKAGFRYQRWSDSAEKWKKYSTSKSVKFPKVMLSPIGW